MKIIYILPLIALAWTALAFAGIPAWMFFKARDRKHNRANGWDDDFQFGAAPRPHGVERAGCPDASPNPAIAGAIHQGAS